MSDDTRLAHHQVVLLVAAVLHGQRRITPASVAATVEKAEAFIRLVGEARETRDPLVGGVARGSVPYVWRER